MKEIGGYLEFESLINNEFYSDLIRLNSARNALAYLVLAKGIKKLYIPFYLCDSIPSICKSYDCTVEYYQLDKKFKPIFNKQLADFEHLYLVNYFGQIDESIILDLKYRYKNVILDNTQAFFQRPINNIDTIYSCRKFFGVPDGAYLATQAKYEGDIAYDTSVNQVKHLIGRYEFSAAEFYQEFKKNEEEIDNKTIRYMSKFTRNLLGAIDYTEVIKKRNENYNYLQTNLFKMNKLELMTPVAPFAYPLYMKDGLEVKKKLALKKIYVSTLWPNVLNEVAQNSIEYDYTANILPLPCDQRYTVEDLKYMVEELNKIGKEN